MLDRGEYERLRVQDDPILLRALRTYEVMQRLRFELRDPVDYGDNVLSLQGQKAPFFCRTLTRSGNYLFAVDTRKLYVCPDEMNIHYRCPITEVITQNGSGLVGGELQRGRVMYMPIMRRRKGPRGLIDRIKGDFPDLDFEPVIITEVQVQARFK